MPSGSTATGGGFQWLFPSAACSDLSASRHCSTHATAAAQKRSGREQDRVLGNRGATNGVRKDLAQPRRCTSGSIAGGGKVVAARGHRARLPRRADGRPVPRPPSVGLGPCMRPSCVHAWRRAHARRARMAQTAQSRKMAPHRCRRRQPPGCARLRPLAQTAAGQAQAAAAAAPPPVKQGPGDMARGSAWAAGGQESGGRRHANHGEGDGSGTRGHSAHAQRSTDARQRHEQLAAAHAGPGSARSVCASPATGVSIAGTGGAAGCRPADRSWC